MEVDVYTHKVRRIKRNKADALRPQVSYQKNNEDTPMRNIKIESVVRLDFERKRRGEANERLKHDYSDNESRIIFEREERNEVTENARKSRVLKNVDS